VPAKERRIVGTVGGSFYVSLPRPWLAFHEIQPGDPVEVLYDDLLVLLRQT
jgi:hypothetical protein